MISNGTSWTIDDDDIVSRIGQPRFDRLDRTLTPSHCVIARLIVLVAVLSSLMNLYNSNKDCENFNGVIRYATKDNIFGFNFFKKGEDKGVKI